MLLWTERPGKQQLVSLQGTSCFVFADVSNGAPSSPVQLTPEALYPVLKRLGRPADRSLPFWAELNYWCSSCLQSALMVCASTTLEVVYYTCTVM
jgi:hypothetical protein